MIDSEKHLSVKEIAKRLQVDTRTIQREISRGKLHADKVGNKFRVTEESLQKYLSREYDVVEKKIDKFIDSNKSDMVGLLQKLVAIPAEMETTESDVLQKYLNKKLEEVGLEPHHVDAKRDYVHYTFGYGGQGLLLNCPMDTVPYGEIDKWKYAPYAGIINGTRMYGRGTADCKAGMVAMIYAILSIKEFVDDSKVRVELVFDNDEHSGNYQGLRNLLKDGLDVSAGIIGYSGTFKEIGIGARGYHRYQFETKGLAQHTGSRSVKVLNAIELMTEFIQETYKTPLPKFNDDWFEFGPKLTFSKIEGGTAINVVPDSCKALLDIRSVPSQKKATYEDFLDYIVKKCKKNNKSFNIESKYLTGEEGYFVSQDEPIIDALKMSYKDVLHENAKEVVHGPAHIGNMLHRYDVPTVVFGPEGGNIHSYDEYVEINSVFEAAKVYARAILYFFGQL